MDEPKAFNKKLRLQLFDQNFNQLSDRLVAQDLELAKGPKEPHTGPMKIEVCLFEQVDVTDFITYLTRLQGKLPLITKVKKSEVKLDINAEGWRENLTDKVDTWLLEQDVTHQETLMHFLRKEGFVFLTWDTLPKQPGPIEGYTEEQLAEYQWMLPLVKEAKNPINNKYDPMLMFGFRLLGKKVKRVLVMSYLKEIREISLPWEDKEANHFKKTEMAKFPVYMTLEEREKFRMELYKYRKEPEGFEFSKFFKRWFNDVDFAEKESIASLGAS